MIRKIILLTVLMTVISCNKNKSTEFLKTDIGKGYSMDFPVGFNKINSISWKLGSQHTFLDVVVLDGTSDNMQNELEKFISFYSKQDIYLDQVLVKNEKIETDGFKGIVEYYEKSNKGKGLGLVNLKSYIVYAIMQDDSNRVLVNSISLSKNINDDLKKSIKSIKLKNKLGKKISSKIDLLKAKKDGSQIFETDNFIIKCKGKLIIDRLRMEYLAQNGQKNSKPYHVFYDGVDYNINISDQSDLLNGRSSKEVVDYNKEDLKYYQAKFNEMKIKNKRKPFKNFDAVYYEIFQDNKLTKAVYFHHKNKSYMLQVSCKKNTDYQFTKFINSFEIINKQ